MRRPARWSRALVMLAVIGALAAAPAAAAACPRTTLADVEDEVMCPQCGVPLALATEAPQANAERRYIQQLIDRCATKEEIKDALVAQFGNRVLALPQDEGFDLSAYLVPLLVLVAAAAGIAVTLVRWRRARAATAAWVPEPGEDGRRRLAPEDAARLEQDMSRYDL